MSPRLAVDTARRAVVPAWTTVRTGSAMTAGIIGWMSMAPGTRKIRLRLFYSAQVRICRQTPGIGCHGPRDPPTYLWGTKVVEMDLSESPRSDAPITDLCGQNLEKVWKWTRWDGDGSPSETPTHRAGDPKSDSGGIVMDWVDD